MCVLLAGLESRVGTLLQPKRNGDPVEETPRLHLLDTGEGQAVLLDVGETEVVIDGGEHPWMLRKYLQGKVDGPIELVIVSQVDVQGFGGVAGAIDARRKPLQSRGVEDDPVVDEALLRELGAPLQAQTIWLPADPRSKDERGREARGERIPCTLSRRYQDFLRDAPILARQLAVISDIHPPAVATGAPTEFEVPSVPGVRFTVLSAGWASNTAPRNCSVRNNNAATVVMLRVGDVRVLFGGEVSGAVASQPDAIEVEDALLQLDAKHPSTLRADVLIVPRQGSSTASSPAYVSAVSPRYALFGSSIRFLHPRPDVIARYRQPGRRLLTTRLRPEAEVDHIVCDLAPAVDCRYGGDDWKGWLPTGEPVTSFQVRRLAQELTRPSARVGESTNDAIARSDPARLQHADLSGLRWQNCELSDVSMEGVRFRGAELQGCEFVGTDLRASDFSEALLTGVTFREANLDGADFTATTLDGARFIDVSMDNVRLRSATLAGVVFEPMRWSLTNPQDLWRSPDLGTLRYERSPHALLKLRTELQNAGLRSAERELTYVIETAATAQAHPVERVFRWAAFDITSEYGRRPVRPLLVLIALIPIFAIAYLVPIRTHRHSAVFRVPPVPRLGLPGEIAQTERLHARGIRACGLALQFSVLSAFHIGWRELNIGNWIARLQPGIYGLTSSGWVRTVAGIQSLMSVYLLALSVLSYFGRPF